MRGTFSMLLLALNSVLCCTPLYLMAIVRLACRGRAHRAMSRYMDRLVDAWVGINRQTFRALKLTRVDIDWACDERLSRDRWYLVISNHQSWADILILQNSLLGRIPPLKFFTKRQLIWVPLIGVAMWVLGFPYVRRASREQVAANPQLLEQDREATLDACRRFRDHPTSALNFLEGTRYTPAKHDAQAEARFEHLLNPKLGGMSYVVTGLGDQLHKIVDVTIKYPNGIPTFWDLMQGRCSEVRVLVQCRDLPADVRSAADSDQVRLRMGPWVDSVWQEKDRRLSGAEALVS